jgi:hypothetical protein
MARHATKADEKPAGGEDGCRGLESSCRRVQPPAHELGGIAF